MTFRLSTAGEFYKEADRRKRLSDLGFTFVDFGEDERPKLKQIQGSPDIEINSLEELINFTDKFGEIIISKGDIKIYDDYL